ncbi:MAG: hypothetical protein K0S36_632 [Nitrosospira multiformis]|nr:hypothetical protein [Nitrosospira multiformis]
MATKVMKSDFDRSWERTYRLTYKKQTETNDSYGDAVKKFKQRRQCRNTKPGLAALRHFRFVRIDQNGFDIPIDGTVVNHHFGNILQRRQIKHRIQQRSLKNGA